MVRVIQLTDRQAARWTVIASFHFQAAKELAARGSKDDAKFHQDAYEFLKHMEDQAAKAHITDKTAVCPLCDGYGKV